MLRPSAGLILLDGQDARRMGSMARARMVALVRQSPVVPEGFSVLDVVLMGRNPHLQFMQWEGRRDMEAAQVAMEATDTSAFADRPLTSLSGGEMQRVFVARALAQAPAVLLLDEPTTHLDLGYQAGLMDTIDRARRERDLAVLVAMHDITLAAQYCDRIAILGAGRVRAEGAPAVVLQPDLLSEVFGARIAMVMHPVLNTPVALPVSGARDGQGGMGGRESDQERQEPQQRLQRQESRMHRYD
jgi:iron complex transport system ATP-binding protein